LIHFYKRAKMGDLGSLNFSVNYENNKLDIKIIQCQGLKDADGIGKSDPYVRLFILPGRHTELKTKTVNNNLNPVFNSSFSFTLTTAQVLAKTAIFQVFDSDFGKDGKLGEARVPFAELQLNQGGEVDYWRTLVPITETLKSTPVVKSRASTSSVSSTVVSRESSVSKKVSNVSSFSATAFPSEHASYSQEYLSSAHRTDHSGMNIRDLNNRLDEVVQKNKNYGEVDTKLIINLLSKKVNDKVSSQVVLSQIEQHLQPLSDEYNQLAMINAEIEILKRENEIMQTRTDEIEEKIRNRSEKERELSNTLRDWESKHHQFGRERDTIESRRQSHEIQLVEAREQHKLILEQLKMMKLDYGKWQGQLNIINQKLELVGSERERLWTSYSAEFEREVECPNIYWEVINEYSKRMDDEVSKLKEMYVSYNSEIKGFEGKEIARLNTTLNETSYAGHGDLNGILGEMEVVKTRMLELEMDKLSIRQKIFEVRFAIDQEEALFLAQFDAKEGALAFLRVEYEAMKRKFFSNMSRVEESEVTRYSRMIDDGSDWVGRKSSKFDSSDRRVIMGLSLTPRVDNDQGEVIGWDIEEHMETVH